jgi:hypothetical protein
VTGDYLAATDLLERALAIYRDLGRVASEAGGSTLFRRGLPSRAPAFRECPYPP